MYKYIIIKVTINSLMNKIIRNIIKSYKKATTPTAKPHFIDEFNIYIYIYIVIGN